MRVGDQLQKRSKTRIRHLLQRHETSDHTGVSNVSKSFPNPHDSRLAGEWALSVRRSGGSCTFRPAKWPRQATRIGSLWSSRFSLQLRGPGDGVAKVPSDLREVDETDEWRCGPKGDDERRDGASADGKNRAAVAAKSGRRLGQDVREGRAAATVFLNAPTKLSMSCLRSALVGSTQAGKAPSGPLSSSCPPRNLTGEAVPLSRLLGHLKPVHAVGLLHRFLARMKPLGVWRSAVEDLATVSRAVAGPQNAPCSPCL